MTFHRTTPAALMAVLSLAACAAPPSEPAPPVPSTPVAARPPEGVTLRALPSGATQSSAAMAFEGGSARDKRTFVTGAILVDHPRGKLLFDAGYGRHLAEHFQTAPALMRVVVRPRLGMTVADQLARGGVRPSDLKAVVLTHAHWDHVSGLEHLKGVPVWVPKAELDFIKGKDPSAELARRLGLSDYQSYDFPDGPYLGFPRSWDVFEDGSVVLAPTPGHTPGAIVAFITTSTGKRYGLVGDTAWQSEGVERPAQKPWLSRWLVDHDGPSTWSALRKLHAAKAAIPDLIVVPAHDARVWETLPRFANETP